MPKVIVLAVVALMVATAATADEGFLSFSFSDEDCVSAVLSSPSWRLNAVQSRAKDEFRKPTAVELNVGTYFQLMVWNGETLDCRNIRPKELVVTDAADNVRVRYPLTPSAEVKANAFGASGAFYTATVSLQRPALARAFGEDGRLHIVTSGGRKTATFQAAAVADSVGYETEAQRSARQARRDEEGKARQDALDKEILAQQDALNKEALGKVTSRLDTACGPGVDDADAYLALATAIAALRTSTLTKESVASLLKPYADCLASKKGTMGEVEAGTLLKKLQ